jgi:hypothetical protein
MLVAAPEPVFVLAMGQLCPARGSHQAQRDMKASGGPLWVGVMQSAHELIWDFPFLLSLRETP